MIRNSRTRTLRGQLFLALCLSIAVGSAAGADAVPVISHSERVDLEAHTETGKYVLFDFYADWCGPCRTLSPFLEHIAREHATQLSVKKIDVEQWQSPVAQQYSISSIPHLKLFDPDGMLIAEGGARKVLHRLEGELGADWPEIGSGGAFPWKGLIVTGMVFGVLFLIMAVTTKGKKSSEQQRVAEINQRYARHAAHPSVAPIWFVDVAGQLEGPYSVEDLRAMRLSGHLKRDEPVRKKKDRQTIPLHTLLER